MEKRIMKRKYKTLDLSKRIHLIIIFMPISSPNNLCVFYSFRNAENLVALIVYSSVRQVATSGIRNNCVVTISTSGN